MAMGIWKTHYHVTQLRDRRSGVDSGLPIVNDTARDIFHSTTCLHHHKIITTTYNEYCLSAPCPNKPYACSVLSDILIYIQEPI